MATPLKLPTSDEVCVNLGDALGGEHTEKLLLPRTQAVPQPSLQYIIEGATASHSSSKEIFSLVPRAVQVWL